MQLLIPDAHVIIHLFELGLWDDLLNFYQVLVGGIINSESEFYDNPITGIRTPIDLQPYIESGAVQVVSLDAKELTKIRKKSGKTIALKNLHDGEIECLAALQMMPGVLFCTGDKCALKFATFIGEEDRLVSLEIALRNVGRNLTLSTQYTDSFRKNIIEEAYRDMLSEPLDEFYDP